MDHTEGTWRARHAMVLTTVLSETIAVADCRSVDLSDAEARANATLIAAAPELLDALEQLVADWDSVNPRDQVPDEINDDAHWAAARAAIAKAKRTKTKKEQP